MLFLMLLLFPFACACLLSDRHLTGPSAPCTPRTPPRGTLAPRPLHGTLRAPKPTTTLPLATGTLVRLASDSLTGTGRLPGAGDAGMQAGLACPARRRLRVTRKQQHGHCCVWPCSLCKLPQHVNCYLSDGLLLSAASVQSLQLLLACDAFIQVYRAVHRCRRPQRPLLPHTHCSSAARLVAALWCLLAATTKTRS